MTAELKKETMDGMPVSEELPAQPTEEKVPKALMGVDLVTGTLYYNDGDRVPYSSVLISAVLPEEPATPGRGIYASMSFNQAQKPEEWPSFGQLCASLAQLAILIYTKIDVKLRPPIKSYVTLIANHVFTSLMNIAKDKVVLASQIPQDVNKVKLQ